MFLFRKGFILALIKHSYDMRIVLRIVPSEINSVDNTLLKQTQSNISHSAVRSGIQFDSLRGYLAIDSQRVYKYTNTHTHAIGLRASMLRAYRIWHGTTSDDLHHIYSGLGVLYKHARVLSVLSPFSPPLSANSARVFCVRACVRVVCSEGM